MRLASTRLVFLIAAALVSVPAAGRAQTSISIAADVAKEAGPHPVYPCTAQATCVEFLGQVYPYGQWVDLLHGFVLVYEKDTAKLINIVPLTLAQSTEDGDFKVKDLEGRIKTLQDYLFKNPEHPSMWVDEYAVLRAWVYPKEHQALRAASLKRERLGASKTRQEIAGTTHVWNGEKEKHLQKILDDLTLAEEPILHLWTTGPGEYPHPLAPYKTERKDRSHKYHSLDEKQREALLGYINMGGMVESIKAAPSAILAGGAGSVKVVQALHKAYAETLKAKR